MTPLWFDRLTTGIEGLKSALSDRTLEAVAAETGLRTGGFVDRPWTLWFNTVPGPGLPAPARRHPL